MPRFSSKINAQEKKALNDTPLRKCNESCYLFQNGGKGCNYYIEKRVSFGETCALDMEKMKSYSEAFLSGDNGVIKSDVSKITASMMMQIDRMIEKINTDGVTVEEPMLDGKGNVIYIRDPDWDGTGSPTLVVAMRIREHPLIGKAIQLARGLGINLNEFKLTPKSADEKPQVSGHIIVDKPEDLETIIQKMNDRQDKWQEAIAIGNKLTEADPIWRSLMDDNENIE